MTDTLPLLKGPLRDPKLTFDLGFLLMDTMPLPRGPLFDPKLPAIVSLLTDILIISLLDEGIVLPLMHYLLKSDIDSLLTDLSLPRGPLCDP